MKSCVQTYPGNGGTGIQTLACPASTSRVRLFRGHDTSWLTMIKTEVGIKETITDLLIGTKKLLKSPGFLVFVLKLTTSRLLFCELIFPPLSELQFTNTFWEAVPVEMSQVANESGQPAVIA